jgi:uncharacterized protein YbjQ (UPF0145 family)
MIDPSMVTTNIELSGYRVTRNLGVVRGITVRSRSILGNIAGGLQTLFGGTISIYDANEVISGVNEVLAYGTAVIVEKVI